jgi:predicted ester cyclase
MRTTCAAALASILSLSAIAQTPAAPGRNEQVIRRLVDAINRHDAKAGAAESSADRKNFGNTVGPKGIEERQADIFTTFPDWHMEIVELIASADIVVVRARVSGTHKGVARMPLNGMPVGAAPTGKRFEVTHMHWYRLRDGQVVEHWANRDDLGMLRQLGLLSAAAGQ